MRQQYARRAQVLTFVMGLIALAIVVQMTRIQNSAEAAVFRQQASNYAYELRTFYPDRGEIYDRNGHLLAGNKSVYELGVDLNTVRDPHAIAFALSSELGENYDRIMDTIINPPDGLSYIVVADYVESSQALKLQELKKALQEQAPEGTLGGLTGLQFKSHPQRSYPEYSLGSNIIGFVNREGKGYFGVEEKYDTLLAGNPVQVLVPTDPNKAFEIPRVPNGTTLVLTINRDLQSAAEDILDRSLIEYGAQGGTIVIMDPRNGELLAMAVTPRMDLNEFWNYGSIYDNASDFNPAISMPYEPGSVIKILTMAAALDSGTVVPETTYLDTGSILVGGATIQNWDQEPWGVQDMTGCLQHSLNVCMATLSTQMGAGSFYSYMDNFGLGQLTGVDLAGEAPGRLKIPGDADWYPVDLGTNSFGQGMTATPMQVMMAASSIANHGRVVTPHALYAMMRDGRQYNVPAQFAGTPISQQTADILSGMLAVSLESEGSLALVPGYRVAGKTGTAQIPVNGFYDSTQTNASFIGWGPIDDPRFMIYVWLERPSSSIWGSETAAPVFAEMAQKTVILMDIPPDYIRQQLVAK
ncbi:MAG: penicillin-binding protein 2 [Anaerolineales bacterium]|jgi:cell division protein FtsI/penicillin-binding protein 2|uniref:peptidoglycan D,D-transpeptidase FtsI family protein n=1 Tax=Candidatus Villigracilis affinis TaxID=3140682 RepID=UPI001D30C36C|nr:penicillin-binding protein 2 [Anaerolineales bacterium]MBK9602862.1 penicillin-binding protein 2 [Anaerolineales bacterium]MBL0346032.1 penicillin-binding protein 2 [Anaerolineales bacterium]